MGRGVIRHGKQIISISQQRQVQISLPEKQSVGNMIPLPLQPRYPWVGHKAVIIIRGSPLTRAFTHLARCKSSSGFESWHVRQPA